ncbi:hypothetical protein Pcinc_002637 [Petrolisthes cinctipes]|uniref:Uncharacterized protein n=1 Tax=Petrolisthes cinctipes TaxID=88211 RepID=A0AAE1L3A3_PETCI|nr:hypothetical protein Pcinc_008883 [Petrolisthes cinctipes]KAK3893572.1 hypothetical protein Pcinc_002637 [Petrolisthes cinctipes]
MKFMQTQSEQQEERYEQLQGALQEQRRELQLGMQGQLDAFKREMKEEQQKFKEKVFGELQQQKCEVRQHLDDKLKSVSEGIVTKCREHVGNQLKTVSEGMVTECREHVDNQLKHVIDHVKIISEKIEAVEKYCTVETQVRVQGAYEREGRHWVNLEESQVPKGSITGLNHQRVGALSPGLNYDAPAFRPQSSEPYGNGGGPIKRKPQELMAKFLGKLTEFSLSCLQT